MTYAEVKKIIEDYPASNELEKSVKDLLKTIAARAYEAGQLDGLNKAVEIQKSIFNADNIPF